ncbi:hypothetical protein FB106_12025 [Synechococcus sp. Ace-Pa]|nr:MULTISPECIES: hypothetical protein [Synechococcaceae]MCT4364784.1 hypothetical protein [Candidatus Regnicoccus frigidus MAG-AL1]MCT4366450.1 hypothetical protein [Candidatus Regnicoccus frigidus MAG-AL2]TWB87690.1 hypothetical protein FB106_12025 [Synechococcus sp. Ace-Pa]
MTTADRLERLQAIADELAQLLTTDELETYPTLEHLQDMIDDQQQP